MSDPQDLLYTNKFVNDEILTKKDLLNENKYYNRYEDYINKSKASELTKYIQNDEYETSPINLDRNLEQKWPINKNKNHYPLFDNFIKDISYDRYQKEIITKINIDSKNRNFGAYPNPNSFSLPLTGKYTNISKFVLSDLNFKNLNQPVTNTNNCLAWQYASTNNLQINGYDNTIIPVPGSTKIIYSNLPNATYSYTTTEGDDYSASTDNYLVYSTNISPGYYSVTELIKNIKFYTSQILHGQNFTNSTKIVEQPYLAYKKNIGTPHLFSTYINPTSNIVRFVNRMEEIKISAIQTFSPYDINITQDDIFFNFSSLNNPSTGNSYYLDSKFIYITLPSTSDISYQYYYNIYCIYTPNAFPLVITNLDYYVGDINNELINYTEFYDLNIYLKNGYLETDLDSISYYKFIDTITFETSTTVNGITQNFQQIYLRFALKLSTGNINGINYNSKGQNIRPSNTNNIVFSNSINNFLIKYGNVINPQTINVGTTSSNNYNTSGILTEYEFYKNSPIIGRALLFRWIFDKLNNNYITYQFQTINKKKRSLLNILAWPIQDNSYGIYISQINGGFKFVHSNIQDFIIVGSNLQLSNYLEINYFPYLSLNLQLYNNEYYFSSNSYIFIKLSFNTSFSVESIEQVKNAVDDTQLQFNQIYVFNYNYNVGIGEDYTSVKSCYDLDILEKEESSIFAKIMLSDIPGNYSNLTSNIQNNHSFLINYDKDIDNVNEISVNIYNPEMEIISIQSNFNFTLSIHEIRDVLKETLINTKTNNVNATGNIH